MLPEPDSPTGCRTDRRSAFDRLYRDDPDPWGFQTSAYERDKRKATLDALHKDRFGRVLEIGCSIGVLTRELAQRCDSLMAVDVSAVAVATARGRLKHQPHVSLAVAELPRDWPAGPFDLIVLSEVLYFMSGDEVSETSRRCAGALSPGGGCLLVNWTGPNDLPLSGDTATDAFVSAAPWTAQPVPVSPSATYRIDLLTRAP